MGKRGKGKNRGWMRAKKKETDTGFVAWILKAFLCELSVWYY